jgi:DTW domain-containing protein YfiP
LARLDDRDCPIDFGSHRCARCRLHPDACICPALRATIANKTRVVIIVQWSEFCRTTNSGHLAALMLERCEVYTRGRQNTPPLLDRVELDPKTTALLYPAEGDSETRYLGHTAAETHDIDTIVVPDGSWRQARRMVRREPLFRPLRRVSLPPAGPSRFRLRKAPDKHALSTYESIAEALALLEDPQIAKALQPAFDLLVERTLHKRGTRRGGIE